MVDVFVSYSTPDRERVRPIVAMLEGFGWSVWWDRQIGAGSVFDREIEKAIDDASCIIVIWSASSVESEWVRNEAGEGLDRGILVPVTLEEVRVPLAFRRIQTISFQSGTFEEEIKQTVSAFVPLLTKSRDGATPYVGRAGELARIELLLGGARAGEGGAVLISGEAGVGKSRLATEIAHQAEQAGFRVLKGSCFDTETSPPFEPFITQLEAILRNVDEALLKPLLQDNAPELSRLLPQLLRIFPEIANAVDIPAEQERRYLLNGISEFLDRLASEQPLLLIFDDLHWADESTCIMFRQLLSRVSESSILVIGTYRDDERGSESFARTRRDLLRERLADDLLLARLDKSGVAELLLARSGEVPPEALVRLIYDETEGNPFFIEEVYRHLDESGKLYNEDGEFRQDIDVSQSEVPRGLRLVIGDRLDRASEICKKALSAAAVIGREFDFELLLTIVNLDDDDLVDAMDEAIRLSALEDLSTAREARYGFVHEQIRQTLLSNLPMPRRQRAHLKVAESLEARSADQFVSEIAHHIYQAGAAVESVRTAEYLERAADKALESLAFESALTNIELALAVLDEEEAAYRAKLQGKCGQSYRGMGKVDEAVASYSEALALAGSGQLYEELLLSKALAEVDYFRGAPAVAALEELLTIAQSRGDKSLELNVRFIHARAHYVVSLDDGAHAPVSIEVYDAAIALAREMEDKALLARMLTRSVQLRDFGLSTEITQARAAEAAELAKSLGDRILELEARTMFGHGVSESAEAADERYNSALELMSLLESQRDPVRLNEHYFRVLMISTRRHYETGVEVADKAVALSHKMGWFPVQYPTFKAFCLLMLGRFDEAWNSLQEEVADVQHPFGAAFQQVGIARYYSSIAAWEPCLQTLLPLFDSLVSLGRTRMGANLSQMWYLLRYEFGGDPEQLNIIDNAIAEIGLSPSGRAELYYRLSEGDLDGALAAANKLLQTGGTADERMQNIDSAMTVLNDAESWDDLITYASEGISLADQTGSLRIRWRLLAFRSQAYEALSHSAEAEADRSLAELDFAKILSTIADPIQRQGYEAQPLAKLIRTPA